MVLRIRSIIAGCDTVRRIRPPPASVTSTSRWPLEPSKPPIGCATSRSLVIAAGTSLSFAIRASTASLRIVMPPVKPILASRSAFLVSSRTCSSFSFFT
jgi:hypothetical protein